MASGFIKVPAAQSFDPCFSYNNKRLLLKPTMISPTNSPIFSSLFSTRPLTIFPKTTLTSRLHHSNSPFIPQGSSHPPAAAATEGEYHGHSEAEQSQVLDFARAFLTFLRPHTLYGTALASCSLAARAWIQNSHLLNWSIPLKAISGFLALLCANSYIVGINQIYDVEIDQVNKPYLPVAAGQISIKQAWLMVTFFLTAGLSLVTSNSGPFLTSLYCIGLLLGTIYSVPPFRMKRFPVAAFLFIAAARGFLMNYGVYYASRSVLGLSFQWSAPVIFITVFVTLFALVIALSKDLSDVEGDRKYNISTFATRLGVRNMAYLGSGILLLNYVAAIIAAICLPQAFRRGVLIPAHAIMAMSLLYQTRVLEQEKYTKEAVSEFYMFLWKLFYTEYLIFPFI